MPSGLSLELLSLSITQLRTLQVIATTLVFCLYWNLTLNIDDKDAQGNTSEENDGSSSRSPSGRQVTRRYRSICIATTQLVHTLPPSGRQVRIWWYFGGRAGFTVLFLLQVVALFYYINALHGGADDDFADNFDDDDHWDEGPPPPPGSRGRRN